MSNELYNITQTTLESSEEFSTEELSLIESFTVNAGFSPDRDFIEVNFYSLQGTLLSSDRNYKNYSFRQDSETGAHKEGSAIFYDIEQDLIQYGFDRSDVKIRYNYLSNLFQNFNSIDDFFIETISEDRTEIRLESVKLTDDEIVAGTVAALNSIQQSATSFIYLYAGNDTFLPVVNIKEEDYEGGKAVVVKLYEPLPGTYLEKNTFTIVEEVANTTEFEVDYTPVLQEPNVPTLRGANFDLDVDNDLSQPSQYLDYNQLFSYPVTNTYTEASSMFNERSVQISIDYSDFSDFINFSSAEERLRNFKYKIDLIQSYETQLELIKSGSQTNTGTSGSQTQLESLINGITNNFDHYEKHLYFESGSTSWPKSNTTRPYENQISTTTEATNWYTSKIEEAENFDDSNYNSLVTNIPEYIKEDASNDPYILFVQMVGQHFDNIWIYSKAVSDKYNADNRLNKGVSKDLVEDLLKNF